ncbi:MAG: type II toxin-antitoxin system RelE/ParE family toxin [Burkholderiales bacterium]|nr:type II toxin-antitoxin system RelE/ParE family toxin [Burkholderiales bacterium]
MKRVRFVAPARAEFLAEVVYCNQVAPGQGARFTVAVEEATARALTFPLSGSPSEPNVRRVVVRNFPFSVVYRPEADGIVVFAVAHHSRRPGYWRSRISKP